MSEINESPQSIFNEIKKLLFIGVKDRKHPYHTPVFSNISKKNIVESRAIVLRKFEEKNLILNFHSDFRSPKILSLKNNNQTSFLFYDFSIKIQLRIKTLSTINNQNKITEEAWKVTNLSSRKCYLSQKNPSSKTNKPEDGLPEQLIGIDPSKEESERGYSNFTVIQNKIEKIDWLYLDYAGHRRLNINCQKDIPEFIWLIP